MRKTIESDWKTLLHEAHARCNRIREKIPCQQINWRKAIARNTITLGESHLPRKWAHIRWNMAEQFTFSQDVCFANGVCLCFFFCCFGNLHFRLTYETNVNHIKMQRMHWVSRTRYKMHPTCTMLRNAASNEAHTKYSTPFIWQNDYKASVIIA